MNRQGENRQPVLHLEGLRRSYWQGEREIRVLDGAGVTIYPGETVALVGPSGAGKSTFLHIVGLLERPDGGRIVFNGQDCGDLGDGERTRIRRTQIGFIYQFHQLLPEFSALENVILPQLIGGAAYGEAAKRAKALLTSLGLAHRLDHRPAELSGGEQQRVAIARALANRPRLLLADEPTGNLDPHTAARVFDQLLALVGNSGLSTIMATHNLELAERMDRVLRMEDGRLREA